MRKPLNSLRTESERWSHLSENRHFHAGFKNISNNQDCRGPVGFFLQFLKEGCPLLLANIYRLHSHSPVSECRCLVDCSCLTSWVTGAIMNNSLSRPIHPRGRLSLVAWLFLVPPIPPCGNSPVNSTDNVKDEKGSCV